ncbi:MAG: methyl-accepting chemotaxis protein [Bacillota bacterium]
MKKLSYRIVLPVIVILIVTTAVIGYMSIQKSSENISRESQSKLINISGRYANQLDIRLKDIEAKTDAIGSIIASTVDMNQIDTNAYMYTYKYQTEGIIKEMAQNTDDSLGAFIFFNPELVGKADDIYFADQNNDGEYELQETLDISAYQENSSEMDWFYKPLQEEKALWSEPFKWQDIDSEIVRFSKALIIDDKFVGTIGIDLRFSAVEEIVSNIKTYDSGFAYLLNNEGNFLIHPDYERGADLADSGFTEEADLIDNNSEGFFVVEDGGQILDNGFATLSNGWKLGTAVPESEVMAGVTELKNYLIYLTLAAVIIAGLIMVYIGRRIAGPVSDLSRKVEEFGRGDLTVEFKQHSQDEIGVMEKSLQNMAENLREIISQIASTAGSVSASSEELTASGDQVGKSADQVGNAIQDVASGAQEQSAQLETAENNVTDLIKSFEDVNAEADNMRQQADNVVSEVKSGNKAVDKSVSKIEKVKDDTNTVSRQINELGELSEEIGGIIEIIKSIADQTNLLALNAAIEAARAGEAGRGFSVVADEIRELAENSSAATEKIVKLIADIQSNVKSTVSKMNSTEETVTESVEAINVSKNSFTEINSAVKNLNEYIQSINTKTAEMTAQGNETQKTVEEVMMVSQQAAGNAEEVAASSEEQIAATEEIVSGAEELSEMADELTEAVNKFKL